MQHHLRAIIEAADVEALRDAIMAGYRALGFHAAYFLAPLPANRGERILTNIGFPADWEREYRRYWHLHDASPDRCLSERQAIIWAEAGVKNLRPDEAKYIQKLADWGMEGGVGLCPSCDQAS